MPAKSIRSFVFIAALSATLVTTGCVSVEFRQSEEPVCVGGAVVGGVAGGVAGAHFLGKGKGKILTGIAGAALGAMAGDSICRSMR